MVYNFQSTQRKKMTKLATSFFHLLLIINVLRISTASVVSTGNFNKDFYVIWSPDHVNTTSDGHERSLKIDQQSGSGFASNKMFLFGKIDMKIKLIPGHSAGTVVAYYLSSKQPNRDEIDFEFLGNVNGESYILQTNIFVDGFGNKEERLHLWFDPTKNFHNYTVLWNINQLVFMVDSIPIRVYRNHANKGVPYPRAQPMSIIATLWNGEDWATRGGRDKIDWSKGPFITSFSDYTIDACVWKGNPRFCRVVSPTNWWNAKEFNTLTREQNRWLKWVRKNHMIYDYCRDNQRFQNNIPKECLLPKY